MHRQSTARGAVAAGKRRVFTYGVSPHADYVLRMLPPAEDVRSRFEVAAGGLVLGPFVFNVPGRHNVLNATAAVAIGTQLDVSVIYRACAAGLSAEWIAVFS